jgi:hypothetical protein
MNPERPLDQNETNVNLSGSSSEIPEWVRQDGTYVSLGLSETSKDKILNFMESNDISNPVSRSDLHATLIIASKRLPKSDYPIEEINWIAFPAELRKIQTQNKTNALVLVYQCEEQLKLFNEIKQKHNVEHSYTNYLMHITLSYSCDQDLDSIKGFEYIDYLHFVEKFCRDACFIWDANPELRALKNKELNKEVKETSTKKKMKIA